MGASILHARARVHSGRALFARVHLVRAQQSGDDGLVADNFDGRPHLCDKIFSFSPHPTKCVCYMTYVPAPFLAKLSAGLCGEILLRGLKSCKFMVGVYLVCFLLSLPYTLPNCVFDVTL